MRADFEGFNELVYRLDGFTAAITVDKMSLVPSILGGFQAMKNIFFGELLHRVDG